MANLYDMVQNVDLLCRIGGFESPSNKETNAIASTIFISKCTAVIKRTSISE